MVRNFPCIKPGESLDNRAYPCGVSLQAAAITKGFQAVCGDVGLHPAISVTTLPFFRSQGLTRQADLEHARVNVISEVIGAQFNSGGKSDLPSSLTVPKPQSQRPLTRV